MKRMDGSRCVTFGGWLHEIELQFHTAFPALLGMVLYKIPWLVSLRFVGGIGTQELAAAALATTLCNVTGLSLAVGLSSALTTLTGQARGDLQARRRQQQQQQVVPVMESGNEHSKLLQPTTGDQPMTYYGATKQNCQTAGSLSQHHELLPLVYLYRGLFIQLLFVLPIGIWWIHGIKPALLFLGQREKLSSMTEKYLRVLTPGLWTYSINWTLTAWFQAIEMAHVPAIAAAVGLALHVPCNLFYIYTLGMGYLGCALATVTFQIVQPLIMLIYLFGTKCGSQRVLNATAAEVIGRSRLSFWQEAKTAVTSLSGILQYLGLAVPGIIIISEWWASEISIFLAGRLVPSPELALGAMALYQSMNSSCFMFPYAIGVAGSTRVGNLLGANNARAAAFAGMVNILCAGTVSFVLGGILFVTPHQFFPSLFAPDADDLILETSRTIPLLSLYVFADGIQCAFSGIIKGCGRQVVAWPVVLVSYWVVGLPLACYLAFIRHGGDMNCHFCGVESLVLGMTTGTWTHMLLLGVVVLGATDWGKQAIKAQERLSLDQARVKRNLPGPVTGTCNGHDVYLREP